jgi:hypothetical protein
MFSCLFDFMVAHTMHRNGEAGTHIWADSSLGTEAGGQYPGGAWLCSAPLWVMSLLALVTFSLERP